ncbi:MAG: adenylosuccinate lyase, partial [Planctomycetota bacterium]
RHSLAAAEQVKLHGRANDLIERLKGDEAFATLDFEELLNPATFIGRSPQQVDEFIAAEVKPVRKKYADLLGEAGELKV